MTPRTPPSTAAIDAAIATLRTASDEHGDLALPGIGLDVHARTARQLDEVVGYLLAMRKDQAAAERAADGRHRALITLQRKLHVAGVTAMMVRGTDVPTLHAGWHTEHVVTYVGGKYVVDGGPSMASATDLADAIAEMEADAAAADEAESAADAPADIDD